MNSNRLAAIKPHLACVQLLEAAHKLRLVDLRVEPRMPERMQQAGIIHSQPFTAQPPQTLSATGGWFGPQDRGE
jgi:hypothetical protein